MRIDANLEIQIYAIWAIYETWSIRTFIVESRWILIAMYNVLLFLALLITLIATMGDTSDDVMVNVTAPFILLSTTTIVIAVYLPTILKQLNIIVNSSNNKTEEMTSKQEEVTRTSYDIDAKEIIVVVPVK